MIVIMPMAGRGSRFEGSGYTKPKPLIEVLGKPMFCWAIESIKNIDFDKIIIISLEEHEKNYRVKDIIKKNIESKTELILLPDVTEGQLATVIAGKKFIDNGEDVLIISSDTIVVSSIADDIANKDKDCMGLISVANMEGDRWSFAKTDESGKVTQVTEKIKISDHASTGIYYFSDGKDFIKRAEKIIENREKTRGEYYVMPVYQKYIDEEKFIGISKADEMWDLGTPDALNLFLSKQQV